ncbi:hypothetical protein DSUL_20168 [Desulfovibrionales bacterium]
MIFSIYGSKDKNISRFRMPSLRYYLAQIGVSSAVVASQVNLTDAVVRFGTLVISTLLVVGLT